MDAQQLKAEQKKNEKQGDPTTWQQELIQELNDRNSPVKKNNNRFNER